jgi:hypothetical protein
MHIDAWSERNRAENETNHITDETLEVCDRALNGEVLHAPRGEGFKTEPRNSAGTDTADTWNQVAVGAVGQAANEFLQVCVRALKVQDLHGSESAKAKPLLECIPFLRGSEQPWCRRKGRQKVFEVGVRLCQIDDCNANQ